jgi:hypothetical protein
MRVQVFRLDGRSESHRVDLDFYLIAAWRLMEQIRQAWVGYHLPGAEELWHEFNTRFPYIDETRDWWIHATDRIVNHSYFADEIMRWTQPPSFVIRTDDLPDLERMYERFCELLGPLPDSKSPTSGQLSEAAARRTTEPAFGGRSRRAPIGCHIGVVIVRWVYESMRS